MRPDVTVVIPTYNRAQVLLRAVRSVLGQTHRNLEMIVVDDASTDGSVALLAAIADSRVRVLRHDRNRGAAAARNSGIAAATGVFVAFLDSDDAWLPHKLSVQLSALRAAATDHEVSCHGVQMHLLDHGIDRTQPLSTSANWLLRLALGCDLSPGATQLTRCEAFTRVGPLDESLPRFEDWDWLLRYAQMGGKVAAVREPLAHVWNRRGKLGLQHERAARLFMTKHVALYDALPKRLRRQAFCDIWLQVSGTYAYEHRPGLAIRVALRAAAYRPLHAAVRIGRHLVDRATAAAGIPSQENEPLDLEPPT